LVGWWVLTTTRKKTFTDPRDKRRQATYPTAVCVSSRY
jgi:hypothetical protein